MAPLPSLTNRAQHGELMVPFILLLFITLVTTVSGQSCSFSGVDLSSKQGQYDIYSFDGNEVYFMTVCALLAAGEGGAARQCGPQPSSLGASTCMNLPSAGSYFNLGSWSTAVWSQMDNGIQYTMTGEPCTGNPGQSYSSIVQFPCAAFDGEMTVKLGANCLTTFIWPTTLTCGTGTGTGNGGLSGGAIAGIVITVLIVIGAIVGLVWYLNRTGRLESIKQAILQSRNGPNQPLIQSAAAPPVPQI